MDTQQAWSRALGLLLEGVDEDDPKFVFLHMLSPLNGDFGDQFIILAENAMVESYVSRRHLPEIEAALQQATGKRYNVRIATSGAKSGDEPAPQKQPITLPPLSQMPTEASSTPDWMRSYTEPVEHDRDFTSIQAPASEEVTVIKGSKSNSAPHPGESALFSKRTFESFVVGRSNEFARNAALAVAENPGVYNNPLFIWGGSGLGKTHLLVAIANYTYDNYPNMLTVYVTANMFYTDFIEASRKQDFGEFNKKYHGADILLIDDVQYLDEHGKSESSIDELFQIFNQMVNQNKQIVLSADRAPKDLNFDERIRSRFVSGLLVDVKPPDYETRLAILKNYIALQHPDFQDRIPDDVLFYIAEVATSNIREIEGAATRLVSNMSLMGKTSITVDEAKELLQDFFPDLSHRQIDIATIQSEVEHFFGVTHEDMISSKRYKGITVPRHIAIYLARYLTEESLQEIGKKFGGRDHTTVMHSVHKIEEEQKNNRQLYDQLEQLTNRLKLK